MEKTISTNINMYVIQYTNISVLTRLMSPLLTKQMLLTSVSNYFYAIFLYFLTF